MASSDDRSKVLSAEFEIQKSRLLDDCFGCISMSARAKHFGRQFIRENQRFTTEMLRPYEYICKNEMHPFIKPIRENITTLKPLE